MKILIFSGTTEGRDLSERLAALGAEVMVSVATEYGAAAQGTQAGVTVLQGRKTEPEMEKMLAGMDFCIDATHPYAVEVTENLKQACEASAVPCFRLHRPQSIYPENTVFVRSPKEAAAYLKQIAGNVLLTTGAKELDCYSELDTGRLYPRVLPLPSSLESCRKAGIPAKNIIAMQGPFSLELNQALIHQFSIACIVTKDGGSIGGFREKADAAEACGIPLVLITRPEDNGYTEEELLDMLKKRLQSL